MTSSSRLALLGAFVALLAVSAAAAEPWDAPPFSADPKALIAEAAKVKAGENDVILLLDEATYSVDAEGQTHSQTHFLYRVVTAKGVEMLDSTSASWQPWYSERPVIRARVVAPDGVVHTLDPKAVTEASAEYERDIFSDERILHAPLPGVSAGAVVEVVIDENGKSVIPGAGKSSIFTFSGRLPEERARLILEGPAATFAPHIVNKAGVEPRTVEKNGRKQIIFERGHADAVDSEEEYLPSDEMRYPYVAFSTGASWGDLARRYAEIVDKQIAAGDLRDVVAAATRGATKREEVVDRLLAYVEANVHYAGVEVGDGSIVPRVPGSVLKNKYGDCKDKATLLVALIRAAGFPAHVALLNAGLGFDVVADLPALSRFNHAIVVVGGETPIWIDPTDEFARAGALPEEDQGRMALIASAETASLMRTPELPSTACRTMETRTFTLPEEGRARVVELTEGTAAEEASMRRYRAESEAEKYKTAMEKYAKSYYLARTFDKISVSDPRDLSKPFSITLEVSGSKSGVVTDGDAGVAVSLDDLITPVPHVIRDYEEPGPNDTAAPARKRQHDFVFPRPFVKEWTYRILLPPGYKARTLPPNETRRLGTTTLAKELATESDGVVVAKFRFDSGKRRLTPAEFEETRIALSKVLSERQITLGFDSIGQAKLNAGDVRGALDEFRRLAALHPKEAQHHIEIARALLAGGLGEAARDEARRAIAIEPSSARAHAALAHILEHDLLGREYHTGFDLAGVIAELRKAKQLDPTDQEQRTQLAEMLAYGEDGFEFGRGNHLSEAIDEYKAVVKDFGAESKPSQPRLMLFLAHAGRWEEMKKVVDGLPDGEQKNLGRILAAAGTSGIAAATHELDGYADEQHRRYAAGTGQTLMALGRYPEAAAMLEVAAQGSPNASQLQPLIKALKKARRGGVDSDTPAGAVMQLTRAFLEGNEAEVRKLLPALGHSSMAAFGFNPKAIPMNGLTPDVLADLMPALADVQTDGSDAIGYRVRTRIFTGAVRNSLTSWVQRDGTKYVVAANNYALSMVGDAVLKMADAGQLEAARTWLNWAREEVAAGGGDDPLSGPPFAALWPKDKATATAEEARLAAAALTMNTIPVDKKIVPILLAARDKAPDEQKAWIDVVLTSAYDDPAKIAEVAGRLVKSHPDSASAFVTWVNALARSGKVDEAESAAKQRLERSPRNHEALAMLSSIAARRSDYTTAAAYARRIVDELTPSDSDYNNCAWITLFTGKNIEQGIDDARRASSTAGRAGAASLHTLAAVYAESGKNLEARQALLQSIERRMSDTPSPSDWYVVGRIAENYGVPDAALAAYKRVEKTPPDGLTTWELTQRRRALLGTALAPPSGQEAQHVPR